jgi:hypothetical protein
MSVHASDAWSIARFCALVAVEADDDILRRSLIRIRDVWIDTANECELQAGWVKAGRTTCRISSEPRDQAADQLVQV